MHSYEGMRALLGTILMCSATALAAPGDAPPPAPSGPSGSAAPVDPYNTPGQPVDPYRDAAPSAPSGSAAAPAPSQQQPAAKAPEPDTQQAPAKAQEPGTPAPETTQPPASEGKANPVIDKPAPAPVDQPAPVKDPQSSREAPGSAAKIDPPGAVAPGPIVDLEAAPPMCRDAGKLAQSRDRNAALSAKVSFAICTANAAMAPLQLVDAEASVQEVDRATSNSLGLLDEVAAAGDPKWAIVALHAEGDLLATMTKRMTDTVPANQPAELRDMRVQMLQPHLQPWIEKEQKAFAEVDRLAKANPQLERSKVAADAIVDSRKRLGAGVATR
jgi:hypothetical protein